MIHRWRTLWSITIVNPIAFLRASQVARFVINESNRVLAECPAFSLVVYLAGLVLATLRISVQPGQTSVESQIIIFELVLPISSTSVTIVQQTVVSPFPVGRYKRRIAWISYSIVQLEVREVLQASRVATPRFEAIGRLISEIDGSTSSGQSRAVKPLAPSVTNAVPQDRLRPV